MRVEQTEMLSQAWSDMVAAFGGDKAQAEAEVIERWQAMQRVNPQATREEAIQRLAWEYQPRPIEHVFPGDNWTFMVKAAQSKAHILLLDLEDAVATTRKDVARKVMVLLIKAFRGQVLTKDNLAFLKAHALPEGRADQLEQHFVQMGEHVQLRPEYQFPDEQMILIRPNNLRTKWAAGDYAEVVRAIGDLIDGIYIPKVYGPGDVLVVAQLLRAIQEEQGWVVGRHKIFVLTELPSAILSVEQILTVAPEVEEAQLGIVDYTAATGGRSIVQQEPFTYMRYPLLRIVEAACAAGKVAGIGITIKLNAEETAVDTLRAIALGFHRKWSVHPAHIDGIARHADQFPRVVRKRLTYPEIEPFDLELLKRLAQEGKPILPPKVFIPRPVVLARSVVTVEGKDVNALRVALASAADMIIVNVERMLGPQHHDAQCQLAEVLDQADRSSKVIAFQVDLRQADQEALNLVRMLRDVVQAVILPSVEHPASVRRADGWLSALEREVGLPVGSIALGARLERPETVERDSFAIATASRRMMWLFLDLPGGLPKEDPSDPTTKGFNYYHSALIAATASAEIDAIGGLSDASQLEAETLFAANLGFHGKLVTPDQAARVAEVMNPPRAGERPAEAKGPDWDAYQARWINSVERALEILELYAAADQDRNLGAVAYNDPVTKQPELVDAATARIYYRQLERALKAQKLTDGEAKRYTTARERLVLALRPGGMEQIGMVVFPGQRLLGSAVTVSDWMVQAFAKASGDRNRYHLDQAYAERSRFKGLVAHGLWTVSSVVAGLGRLLPAYRLESLGADFKAPVYFGDTITPVVDVLEILEGGRAKVRFSAMNQEGKAVCEGSATLIPQPPTEVVSSPPEELAWLKGWAQDVTASMPATVYDFSDPQSPRQQTFTKTVTEELIRATRALFGELGAEQVKALLALGTMAMTSAESAPGHLLLNAKVVEVGAPIQAGDVLTMTATVPPPDQIRRSQKGKGQPIVPVEIGVTNQRGERVLRGQVVKLMEEQ